MATAELKIPDQSASDGERLALFASAQVSAEEAMLIRKLPEAANRDDATAGSTNSRQGSSAPFRMVDIVGSLALIVLLLPVMVLLVLVCGLSSSGSPFYAHRRVGKGGVPFDCLKFRTMYVGSEQKLQDLLATDPASRAEWERVFKLHDDPRITPVGKVLRSTSLDELPQLFNVLKGEMSLVGPRPVTKAELQRYGKYLPSYLSQRPGLTGLWQVTGRGETNYRRRVATDHLYARRKSLNLDFRILLATVPAVIFGKGAC